MLNWLRSLLRSSRPVGELRWTPGAPVIFLSLPPGLENGVDPRLSQEELVAVVREAAKDLSQSQGFAPFWYAGQGGRRLPVFTSEEGARDFVKAYVQEVGRIMPFQVLTAGSPILAKLAAACDVLVVDERTSKMREIRVRKAPSDAA
jgi:hypothetical protein